MHDNSLRNIQNADVLYRKVAALTATYFKSNEVGALHRFTDEANLLLNSVRGTDSVIAIFDNRTFTHLLEVGGEEFWGHLPETTKEQHMAQIMGLLNKDYLSFFSDSVNWLTNVLDKIPFEQKTNIQIYHCGIRYTLLSGKLIALFSKGTPLQYDENRDFTYTFNYVQNVNHLLKKDFRYYWIRISYGNNNEHLHTFHSQDKLYSNKDLLSQREKEILQLISDDFDTKDIAQKLFISTATVGNHRSNMIEKLGARDTTALVQLAKIAGIIT